MKLKTKKMLAFTTITLSIVAILGSISYAYFTAMGETKPQNASLTAGVMSLRFTDNDAGINSVLNFDESVTKKFTLENTGTVDATAMISWLDLINTYTSGSLTYTLSYSEVENGAFTEIVNKTNVPISEVSLKKTLATNLTVPAGKTYYYDLVITLNYLNDVNQDADINASFSTTFEVADISNMNVVEKIITSSNGVRTEFGDPATTDEGIFEMADDYGTSYYYRGSVENNYVEFAGFYWRIIRLNGDGSLRIIYDGTQAHANGESSTDRFIHTNTKWTTIQSDAKYVGWMFGEAQGIASTSKTQAQTNNTNSEIKTFVDSWYKTNIVDKGFSNVVSDTLFCNDRSTPGQSLTGWNYDTGLGYGRNVTAFGAVTREGWSGTAGYESPQPRFTCPQKNDAFTVNDTTKGNGDLTYPVGLITADEIVAAGSGRFNTPSTFYLYRPNKAYWSMTPGGMYPNGYATLFIVGDTNGLFDYSVFATNCAVAPVINLSADYASTMKGTGTMNNPYRSADIFQ